MLRTRPRHILTGFAVSVLMAACVSPPVAVSPTFPLSPPVSLSPTPLAVAERREAPAPTPTPFPTSTLAPTRTPLPTAAPSPIPTATSIPPTPGPTQVTWTGGVPADGGIGALRAPDYFTGTFGIYATDYFADPVLLIERQSQPFLNRSP